MYDTDHMTTGGWIFGSAMMVLLIVLVVIAVVWLVRWSAASGPPAGSHGGGSESARQVLDRRLASGEIDEEEYRRLRAALSDAAPRPAIYAAP
jgi:putative membrane protein